MPLEILSPSEQVANHLREMLRKGRWSGKLPGTPALARELDVDRKTIMGALNQLEEQGLLKAQGPGRPRAIISGTRRKNDHLIIRLIPYDQANLQSPMVLNLIKTIEEAGFEISVTRTSLMDLDMDLERVAKLVESQQAHAWIPVSASREILEWFASQQLPTFAIFGRRRQLKLASAGPDKVKAMRKAVARLVELGHRRIVWLAREERVLPTPGYLEMQFLKTLQAHGIVPGEYHLPHWHNKPESFHECIERLFQHTPPTALIADESKLFIGAQQHLAQRHIIAPRDISLVCCDNDNLFKWCYPKVTHIHWDTQAVINQAVYWIQKFARGINNRKATYIPAKFIEGETIGPVPEANDPSAKP